MTSTAAGIGGDGAGTDTGSDRGYACHGAPVDANRWSCFDTSALTQPDQSAPTDCVFDMPTHIDPDVDVGRLGILYVAGDIFEIPYLSNAADCGSVVGGWFLGFDDAGVRRSVHVCACSCAALSEATLVALLARCQ
ncbi:MAG: hypothetical protein WDO69_28020 [Pseudomonadota bacterium]